ncbi:MAG: glycosyltransferase 87 family protein [Aggregatilineales bacterium]
MTADRNLKLGHLLSDFRLLLILFVTFRLVMFIAYQPFFIDEVERGIGVGGDRLYHYQLASFAEDGLLPFRDWWSEFPPLWYGITTGTYLLTGDSYDTWSLLLAFVMLAAEAGNLILMRGIGSKLHGRSTGMALAWVYALLIAPAIFMWWNFDSLVTLFLLLGLYYLIHQKHIRSGIMIAIGALFKFVPFLLFGALLRFRDVQTAGRTIAVALAVFMLAYLPLFAVNSEFTAISLTAQFGKPSYQTVWALIDGNYGTGNFGSVESHLSANGVTDGVDDKEPATIPGILRLGIAAAIGTFVFWRTKRFDDIGLVAFVGITLLIFYLQSQGWSPQWLTQILPLLLLVFPTRNGVLIAVMLSILAFAEYPFIFIRTAETGGEVLPSHPMFLPWVMVIGLRTLMMLGICIAYYQKLRQEPIADV